MAAKSSFERLVRFEDDAGKETYGDVTENIDSDSIVGSSVEVLEGDFKSGFKKTGMKATIRELLSPVPPARNVLCIGLNYRRHAVECKLAIPKYPPVFNKPPDSISGPFSSVHVDAALQSQFDYEGELTAIIGQDCKNVPAADALDYILGYTIGNDMTARDFQFPPSVGGGQVVYSKSFDNFAPIGPWIVAAQLVGDPQKLNYTTKVNGEVRQQTETNDMIWGVAEIVEHLSRGTTLRAGTAIMTGTPGGVGFFMEPQCFLKDGDVVEIEVERVGRIRNKVVFD